MTSAFGFFHFILLNEKKINLKAYKVAYVTLRKSHYNETQWLLQKWQISVDLLEATCSQEESDYYSDPWSADTPCERAQN
jgi:hypothetical protein